MSAAATRWWSRSKGEWSVLEDMVDRYLLNCHALLLRGEYKVPPDPDDPLVTVPVSEMEKAHLLRTFDAEFKRRGIGPYAPPEQP